MRIRTEKRWALQRLFGDRVDLLGRYCFPGAGPDDLQAKTFRTRALARAAQADCCYRDTSVVRVTVTTLRSAKGEK